MDKRLDNNKRFQEFVVDQFAKMHQKFEGLNGRLEKLEASQVRMEAKFDKQITALHDFRVSQDQANKDNKDAHITFATKIEELQFEARTTDQKLAKLNVGT
jgi:predicted nuclease with TOPRIM domain